MLTFEESGLRPEIRKAVTELGFTTPTPIQTEAIPLILAAERDLIASAQTGTGKTAAFGLPLTQLVDAGLKNVQALILCPTRELANQITGDLRSFSKYVEGLRVTAVYGGASISQQIRELKRGSQIIAGTPGRVLDLINRGALDVSGIRWLVLDEADEMLNMGFQEDLDAILASTPESKQTFLFSATMPREIRRLAQKYMGSPLEISVAARNASAENVRHEYFMVHARNRYEALKRIADMHPEIYGIVFCRTRRETQEIARKFIKDGYNADAIHGDLSQAQRDEVMGRFRSRHLQFLIATDVAARGLDVDDITHVINYELPDDLEVYIHRSGRTGRAGKSGVSISIIHSRENHKIRRLEKMSGKKFLRQEVPSGKDVCARQLLNLVEKVVQTEIDEHQIGPYLPQIEEMLDGMDRETLIKKVISTEFNRFLSYYKGAPDLNVSKGDKPSRKDPRSASYTRFFVNVGFKNGLDPQRLMGVINENLPGKRVGIGKIEIMKKFSFFEVEEEYERDIEKSLSRVFFNGVPLHVEKSKPEPKKKYKDGYHKKKARKKKKKF